MSHGEDEIANPYSPPLAELGQSRGPVLSTQEDLIAFRKSFSRREALVRLFSLICFFPILLWIISAARVTLTEYRRSVDLLDFLPSLFGASVPLLVMVWVWSGFRRLRRWAYWTMVLLILGVALLTVGGIIERALRNPEITNTQAAGVVLVTCVAGQIPGGLLLFLLLPTTRSLFTARYRDVIARTPEIKPRLGARPYLIIAGVIVFDVAIVAVFRLVVVLRG